MGGYVEDGREIFDEYDEGEGAQYGKFCSNPSSNHDMEGLETLFKFQMYHQKVPRRRNRRKLRENLKKQHRFRNLPNISQRSKLRKRRR